MRGPGSVTPCGEQITAHSFSHWQMPEGKTKKDPELQSPGPPPNLTNLVSHLPLGRSG